MARVEAAQLSEPWDSPSQVGPVMSTTFVDALCADDRDLCLRILVPDLVGRATGGSEATWGPVDSTLRSGGATSCSGLR